MAEWWWCLEHQRAEDAPDVPAARRLGPYPSREAAVDWKQRSEAREDRWDTADEQWSGDS